MVLIMAQVFLISAVLAIVIVIVIEHRESSDRMRSLEQKVSAVADTLSTADFTAMQRLTFSTQLACENAWSIMSKLRSVMRTVSDI